VIGVPNPDEQKGAFKDVNQMLKMRYEEFDYLDWLDEIKIDVGRMLPTGLEILAVVIKGPKPQKTKGIESTTTLWGLDSLKEDKNCTK
jgi:hypothetical protein